MSDAADDADAAVFVTLYIRVANMAVPIENINRPLGSVCCDGEFAITLLYESIACSVMMANGFVIAGVVRMYINPHALCLYRLWYSISCGIPFIWICYCGCVLRIIRRLRFVNPGA